MRKHKIIVLIIFLISVSVMVNAQEETETPPDPDEAGCPELVTMALEQTETECEDTGLNEACYGNSSMDAQPRPGIPEFTFSQPGHKIDLIDIESLRLSTMDVAIDQWGVTMLYVEGRQADRASDDDGVELGEDAVQYVLFGDVEIGESTTFLGVTALEALAIRSRPTTDSDPLAELADGVSIVANGRLEDSTWVRVRLPGDNSNIGWIKAEFVVPDGDGDLEELAAIPFEVANTEEPGERATYGPMQIFSFQSGQDDAPCAEAPNSGILIQTPEGAASISIWMDEVVITMDATAFVQVEPGGDMTISILEGSAQVEADGVSRTIIPGTQVTVPIDDNLVAVGQPSAPEAFVMENLDNVPVGLLDEVVTIPQPVNIQPGVPFEGNWLFSWGVQSRTCPDGTEIPFSSIGTTGTITAQEGGVFWHGVLYTQTTQGVYTATYADDNGNLHRDTLQVQAGDRISGEKVIELVNPVCTLNVPFSVQLISSF